MEDDDEGSGDSDSSDTDTGRDGPSGGSGPENHGNRRDGASGDRSGSDSTPRYPRDGNHSSKRNRGSMGSGGTTDGIGRADDRSTEFFEPVVGRQSDVEDGSKGSFWSEWLSSGSDTVTTTTSGKVDSAVLNWGGIDQQRSQWFQSGSGISREVFMVEVARHFGPGTTIRTGSIEGVEGYWVTASCGPSAELVRCLKLQTEKWEEEIRNKGTTVSYSRSSTYKTKHTDDSQNVAALPRNSISNDLPRNLQSSAPDARRPEFRSIVNCYEHSGSFSNSPEATTIFNQLLVSFNPETGSVIRSKLQAYLDHQISDRVYKTMVSISYIKKSYPSFDGVWELVIRKAETWVDSVVHVPILRQELESICSANWTGMEVHNDESFKVEEDQFREASRPYQWTPYPSYTEPQLDQGTTQQPTTSASCHVIAMQNPNRLGEPDINHILAMTPRELHSNLRIRHQTLAI
ncbi:MAG: hypothetical protein M1840_001245 [Geoglossum simile]|nr:MAG: hypothetical protein M1840_001245 [Geoglossum simile]